MSDVNLKTDVLQNLMKSLKGKLPVAHVGILGRANHRDGRGTNSTVGAAHEFGTINTPQRSFLRKPITENLAKKIASSKGLNEVLLKQVVAQKSIEPIVDAIGVLGVATVLEAFDSGSDWVPLKTETVERKGFSQILVETGQLRDSISYEVVSGGGS